MSIDTYNRSDIPAENEVGGRFQSRWRIADGVFRKGRDADGTTEERSPNKIVGIISAFRVYEGVRDLDGTTYVQLEADIVTNSGSEYIKVDRNMKEDRWPTSAISLAKYLTAVEPGKIYCIEPQKAKKPNSFGSYNTFVDVAIYNPIVGRLEGIQTQYDGEKFTDVVDDIFDALKKHPLYSERAAPVPEAEKSEYRFFEDALQAKEFPSYAGNEAAWTAVFNEWLVAEKWDALDQPHDPANALDDADWWNFYRQKLEGCKTNPVAAKTASRKGPGKASAATTEEDPFKEE